MENTANTHRNSHRKGSGKIREILNFKLACTPNNSENAKEVICMYVKNLCWILENKVNIQY